MTIFTRKVYKEKKTCFSVILHFTTTILYYMSVLCRLLLSNVGKTKTILYLLFFHIEFPIEISVLNYKYCAMCIVQHITCV